MTLARLAGVQLCDMEGCLRIATGYVEAQWSIADFVRYESCDEHPGEMLQILANQLFDGRPPLYLNVQLYLPSDSRL